MRHEKTTEQKKSQRKEPTLTEPVRMGHPAMLCQLFGPITIHDSRVTLHYADPEVVWEAADMAEKAKERNFVPF